MQNRAIGRLRTREITILDRVYEHVTLPAVVAQATDTNAFQRLRSLKQLGASSYLYPGAVHTRFEHSIGVAHMARTLLWNIQRKQPELNISEGDVHNAMLAGLFHDIGHGPFSHLFEDVIAQQCGVPFDHEEMSQRIARTALSPLIPPEDVEAVLLLMRGQCSDQIKFGEVISNKRSGVDVDRLDYFIRDSMCCFGKPPVDVRVNRLFNSARLVCVDNQWQFAFEEKLALSLRELFALRAKLHKSVYQHQVVKAVGHMIGDVMSLASPYFRVHGHTLAECAVDEYRFLFLGDWILEAIEASDNANLLPAQRVLQRLRLRDLYRVAFTRTLAPSNNEQQAKVTPEQLKDLILDHADPSNPILNRDDFIVDVVVINQGKGPNDPIHSIYFFNPKQMTPVLRRIRDLDNGAALFSPRVFEERTVMVFERNPTRNAVRIACERLANDPAYTSLFTESIPFFNQS